MRDRVLVASDAYSPPPVRYRLIRDIRPTQDDTISRHLIATARLLDQQRQPAHHEPPLLHVLGAS